MQSLGGTPDGVEVAKEILVHRTMKDSKKGCEQKQESTLIVILTGSSVSLSHCDDLNLISSELNSIRSHLV